MISDKSFDPLIHFSYLNKQVKVIFLPLLITLGSLALMFFRSCIDIFLSYLNGCYLNKDTLLQEDPRLAKLEKQFDHLKILEGLISCARNP